jgi:RND family efflux transporter MFP subunit
MYAIINFLKNHKIISGLAIIIIAGVIFVLTRGGEKVQGDFVTLAKTDVIQEVDLTGRIEPAEKVELTSESSGKVKSVNVKVSDAVSAGDVLVQVDDTDLRIQLQKQQLTLHRAQLALDEAQKPAKTATQLQSQNDLERAYEDRFNAQAELKTTVDEGYNAVSDAFLDLPDVITNLQDILGHSYLSDESLRVNYGRTAQDYRNDAITKYEAAKDSYDEVIKAYRASSRQSDQASIQALIMSTYGTAQDLSDAIKVTRNLVDYVERRESETTKPSQLEPDQTELDALTRTANTHLVDLLDIKNKITASEQTITDASRIIDEKDASNRDLLDVDDFDVENKKIDIQQAELDIQETESQIDKRSIKSPIDGIVSEITAKKGQNISPGTTAVSVLSATHFQVSANLAEIDLAKVKNGMEADVTLDAYSSEVNFPMIVSAISPAESIVEGVAVYKITLQFVKADDRIKSGLTADITIKSDHRDDVLAVPQRAVIAKNGGKFVQVKNGETTTDKSVTTGLRGSDGSIEIISGLQEGDQVLVFSESK